MWKFIYRDWDWTKSPNYASAKFELALGVFGPAGGIPIIRFGNELEYSI